jgi:predicted HAD superfamily Cof-like phosphohydrolase
MNNKHSNKTDWFQDMREMHKKFKFNEVVKSFDKNKLLDYLKFRIDMIQEEVNEAKFALGEKDADGIVDALVDISIFAISTLEVFEIDGYKAWNAVHEKNMEKSPGVKKERPNPWNLPDLIKPEGWTAPYHNDNLGLLTKVFSEQEA